MGLPTYDPISGKWLVFEPYVPPNLRDPSKDPYQNWGVTDPLFVITDPKTGAITYNTYTPPKTWLQDIAFISVLGLGAYIIFKKVF